MPTFSSFADFGQALGRLQADMQRNARDISREMAEKAQKIATSAASADLGGDPKFSGWAPTLDTRVRRVGQSGAVLHPTRTSAGPWTVAEFGRNSTAGPRMTGPRLTRTGRVSKARQKRWNGRTVGKNTASDAVARMERELPRIAEKGLIRVTRKHFDVS